MKLRLLLLIPVLAAAQDTPLTTFPYAQPGSRGDGSLGESVR